MNKYDKVNEAATFDPQFETLEGEEHDGSRPCLTVAGVQIYAYVGEDGTLRVSVDLGIADRDVFGEDAIPVQVALNGHAVYYIDTVGAEWFDRDAELDD